MALLINFACWLIGAALIFITLKYVWVRRKIYLTLWKCGGPLGSSFYNTLYFAFGPSEKQIPFFLQLFRKYKGLIPCWQGTNLIVFLRTPEDLQTLLNDPRSMEKSDLYDLVPFDALATVPVEKWKQRRKLIQPSFNHKFIDGFMEMFHSRSIACSVELEKFVGDESFDISRKLRGHFTRILCDSQLTMPSEMDEYISEKIERIVHICALRVRNPLYMLNFIFNRTATGKEYNQHLQSITGSLLKIITAKRKLLNEAKLKGSIEDHPVRYKTILETLMESSEGLRVFSDKDLVNFMFEVLFVGTDTSTGLMSATLMIMSMFPQVQEKLFVEINEIFGNSNSPITMQDLKKADYLDRVIKETLRLFPFAPIISRKATSDIQLEKIKLPAEIGIGVNIQAMHINPDYWKEPSKFDPDRFLPEEMAKRHPYSFIPFSQGPRNCLGYVFGLISIKVLLINLLRKFRFRNVLYKNLEEIKLEWKFALVIKNGCGVVVEKREE